MIEKHVEQGDANFVCLWIDSPGGSLIDSMTLANYLAGLDASCANRGLHFRRSAGGTRL